MNETQWVLTSPSGTWRWRVNGRVSTFVAEMLFAWGWSARKEPRRANQ